ncbi:hypothetical protein SODALDRAFT_204714 [Sodiomyces alkalinus F11]|uniref:Concanavalin A-like lectin/glucanase n=1 Tax=Sodiomyces alkalinus (strain CBS 110278 / VKM F-3762 / F11) TaxID=1314773 RepID=A0A3N2PQN7_SODAK|nr:hypothetical protein SODALDRAFT_204714 [Sodiomyces alkalinus F11]ROT36676.1 hypothetical protein SODALDRAFT_204714 [Sodiomyces alkalinus F11]
MPSFTLSAKPGTDIWRKPPTTDVFNAPTKLRSTKPLSAFHSASVTFSGKWTEQYDQAGLVLVLQPRHSSNTTPQKWLKTGVELYNGVPQVSTVACDRYADWSVSPLAALGPLDHNVTVTIEREEDHNGHSAWVYYVHPESGERKPLREVCWFSVEEGHGEWDLSVGAYVARPATNVTDSLTVEFSDLDINWR